MQASRTRENAPAPAASSTSTVATPSPGSQSTPATQLIQAAPTTDDRERARHAPYMDLFRGCKLVLDVCCGSGVCLELLRERTIDAIGLDPDAALVGRCVKRGLPARALQPLEIDRIQGPFDGIHVHNVIERLGGEDVVRFLRVAYDALYVGGLLVIRTPDWDNPGVRGGGFWLDLRSLRPYPLPLLEELLQEVGFDVLRRGRESSGGCDAFVVTRKRSTPGQPNLERLSLQSLATAHPEAIAITWREASQRAANAIEKPVTPAGPVTVRLEGSKFVRHGVGLVNRELAHALLRTGRVELSLAPFEADSFGPGEDARHSILADRIDRPFDGPLDVHVRHLRSPDFTPPIDATSKWIQVLAWPYSRIPKAWLDAIHSGVDEVWTPSESCRRAFVESGVPETRVFVVPFGVNAEMFKIGHPPLTLGTKQPKRFLFMGGTTWRKGIDVVLDAYGRAFRRSDGVCLVIKETGLGADPAAIRRIRAMQADPRAPEILYLGEVLAEKDMPRLYAACHALLHPYRAEAYGLAVAEAVACGLPVILTRGGACDSIVPEDAAYWIPAKAVALRSGFTESLVGPATVLEPDVDALAERLREVADHFDAAALRGKRGSETVRATLPWDRAATIVLERLNALRDQTPRRAKPVAPVATPAPTANGRTGAPVVVAEGSTPPARPQVASAPVPEPAPSEPSAAARPAPNSAKPVAAPQAAPAVLPTIERSSQSEVTTHQTAAQYYLERGNLPEAQRHLERLLQLRSTDVSTLNSLGSVHYRQGDSKRALEYFQRAVHVAPGDPNAHYNLAMIHVGSGRRAEGIAALERAAELGMDDAELWNNLSVLCFEEGDTETAQSYIARALDKHPDYVDALLNLALMDIRLGRYDRAREGLTHIQRLQPENAEAKELLDKLPPGK
ncbi:MAG: tetratricopeptide repeat protein [Planctomycetes bacterium]|nr:tetratricopeptide repeat protein [Planctomycetota bacterium]